MTGSGYVREVGPGTQVAKPGDPVLLSFSYCRDCEPCKRGHPAHCFNFNVINFESVPEDYTFRDPSTSRTGEYDIYGRFFGQSSFASWSVVREDSVVNVAGLVKNRDELELLAPLGCGIQTGTGSILNAANASATDRVVILGLGGVGLSAVMGAKIAGCKKIVGIDRHPWRMDLAKQLGATDVINSNELEGGLTAMTGVVREMTGGLGANITLDTTGSPSLISEEVKITAFKGIIMQVGSASETQTLTIPIREFMVSGKQFMGVVEGDVQPDQYIPQMIKWVQEAILPLRKIVKRYPAEDFEKAISDMRNGETIKPILVW